MGLVWETLLGSSEPITFYCYHHLRFPVQNTFQNKLEDCRESDAASGIATVSSCCREAFCIQLIIVIVVVIVVIVVVIVVIVVVIVVVVIVVISSSSPSSSSSSVAIWLKNLQTPPAARRAHPHPELAAGWRCQPNMEKPMNAADDNHVWVLTVRI